MSGITDSFLGIDLGSRAVKIAIFKAGKLRESKIFDTAAFYREYCNSKDGKLMVDFSRLGFKTCDKVISTGYGRNNVNIEGAEVIVELKAHIYGAVWQTGLKNFTLLDVGGQDTKAIAVKNGRMVDMFLNDKCAASCGRYLENMANILGVSIGHMAGYYEQPVDLSSTCAVFGESELIGKISEGYSLERLSAGVNYSLFLRIKPMVERFPSDTLVVSGGVAQNKALLYFLKSETGFENFVIPENPQMNGAIGCCAYAIK